MQHATGEIDAAQQEQSSATSTAIVNSITIAILDALLWLSMAAIIFAGPMEAYIGRAVSFIIVGAFISMAIIGYRSSWRGTIGMPQDVPVTILAVVSAQITAAYSAEIPPDHLFATIVATIGIASIATGVLCYLLGRFQLGNLVRYLPFPVLGGFLGGTGLILLMGGVDIALSPTQNHPIFHPQSFGFWLPAIVLALLVHFASNRFTHPLVLPAVMVMGVVVFYGVALALGVSVADLSANGWLIGALPAGGGFTLLTWSEIQGIEWGAIASQSGTLFVLATASAIAFLLNISGFELSVETDLDPNHDLKVTGIANIVSGVVGGWTTYLALSYSTMNARDGKQLPLTAVLTPIFAGGLLWFATQWLSFLPRFVFASMIVYLGIIFIVDWIVEPAKRLPRIEYLMLLLIVVVIGLFGFLEGVAVGLFVAVILFAVNYGRINVVRHALSGKVRHSRVTRPKEQSDYLQQAGDEIQILQLHGYIFFGTASRLLDQVRELIVQAGTRYLILDFKRVTGIDSTAALSFAKMQQLAAQNNTRLMLARLSAENSTLIKQEMTDVDSLETFDTVDQALQSAEEIQLVNANFNPSGPSPTLEQQLQAILPNNKHIAQLLALMEQQTLESGHYLMRQGDPPNDMYFVKDGGVTAQLEREDGSVVRLESMGAGRVVGELGFYLGQTRTAAVVTNKPSTVYRLDQNTLTSIEEDHPEIASTLHQIIIHLVSDRTTHLVNVVNALQQ